jgi:hypothetical protein
MYVKNLNLLKTKQHPQFKFELKFENKLVLQLGFNRNPKKTWNFWSRDFKT